MTDNNEPFGNLSSDQAASMGNALLRSGADPQRVHAALEREGVQLTPDDRTDAQRRYDDVFGASPPEKFNIDWRHRTPADVEPDKLHVLDAQVRGAFSAMGFASAIGSSVAEMALSDAMVYNQLSDQQRKSWEVEQRANLASAVGAEHVDETISHAKTLLSLVKDKDPAGFEELSKRGAWRSARTIVLLAQQAQRMLLRGEL